MVVASSFCPLGSIAYRGMIAAFTYPIETWRGSARSPVRGIERDERSALLARCIFDGSHQSVSHSAPVGLGAHEEFRHLDAMLLVVGVSMINCTVPTVSSSVRAISMMRDRFFTPGSTVLRQK
jgi:hypothetical protein